MTIRNDLHLPREARRAQRRFRHKAWMWYLKLSGAFWAALTVSGCFGQVERDADSCEHTGTGLTAVSWCECLAMVDGSTRCVALTDPKQFDECWWNDVVAVTASHPLSEDGTCEP